MFHVILLCWCSWSLMVVFGLESVSVTERESVTLYMNITEQQKKGGILWKFGLNKSLIAEIKSENNEIKLYNDRPDERFNNRLKLNLTGSLTITNTTIKHSGLYQITTKKDEKLLNKTFNITVYTRLPVPVISRVSSQCSSSSKCSVLCSVMNVTHVSLSWYNESHVHSSISVSDLNIRLSLPLEVEYEDNNTYRCVINNTITNQTQLLNINDLCQPCSGSSSEDYIIPLSCAAGSLMIVTALLIFCICRKHRKTNQEDQVGEEEITYADPTFYKRQTHKQRCAVEEDVVYAGVMRR